MPRKSRQNDEIDLCVQEFLKELKKLSKSKDPNFLQGYIGTSYPVAGFQTPTLKKFLKESKFSFSCLPPSEQLNSWTSIWNFSDHFEAMTCCLYFIRDNLKKFDPLKLWDNIQHWPSKIDNWAHSDTLSSIYCKLSDIIPAIDEKMIDWNLSNDSWKRRISLITMMAFKTKKNYPSSKICQSLIESCIFDDDYFIQKGLGWAMREMRKIHPNPAQKLLEKHLTKMSSIAFTTATEWVKPGLKKRLKLKRNGQKKSNQFVIPVKKVKTEEVKILHTILEKQMNFFNSLKGT